MTQEEDFSDLDVLMSQDPLGLSDQDIDRIIAYQRKQRALRAAGVKIKKETGPAPKIDLSALMAKPAVASSSFKRRV